MTSYEICSVPNYKINYDKCEKINKPITTIKNVLVTDLQFHERLHKTDNLKLSIDVDKLNDHNPDTTLEQILTNICDYFSIQLSDISYTTNFSIPSGSHHIVIPKFFMLSSKQKQLWIDFKKKFNYGHEIDAGIFDKDGWFRLPNQTKESKRNTQHIIQQGNIEDFVLKYIPDDCIEYIPKIETLNFQSSNKPLISSNKQFVIEDDICDNLPTSSSNSTSIRPVSPENEIPTDISRNTDEPTKLLELLNIIRLPAKERKNRNLWMSICSFIILNKLGNDTWISFCENNQLHVDKEKEDLYNKLRPLDVQIYYDPPAI
jgi:hypothetical protein